MGETTVKFDEVELFVVTRGRGTPVVLLGGPWFGQTYLGPIANGLSGEFETVGYDPRGSGKSHPVSPAEITLEAHLEDLDGLREALGIDRVNLIGHSLGALVVLLFAARHPEKTGALVLSHPGPPFAPEMMKQLHHAFMKNQTDTDRKAMEAIAGSDAFQAVQPEAHEAFFKAMYSAFFRDRSLLSQLDFGFTAATVAHAMGAEEQLTEQILALDPASLLSSVRSPTLVLHAEHDLIPLAFSTFLAAEIEGAQLVVLEGVGHFS
ncbi:MAG TPA: alpha/beta hydrolase, partial [Acidimicrobiia bacterium]|nr:alpha/beta hydrolase [Acidimicrobiia bacterium]